MRPRLLALTALTLSLAPLAFACSAVEEDADSSDEALSDTDLAKSALSILGAKVDGSQQQCNRCHDVNTATLQKWSEDYTATLKFISDESKSADERINYMRRDPGDPTSTFAPAKLGFLAAGAHLGASASVDATKHPTAFQQMQVLNKLFEGKDDVYTKFRADVLMPIEPEYDRLTAAEFNSIATWVTKGMPKLKDILHEEARPTTCVEDFSGLRAHASEMKANNWASVNQDNRVPMFGCEANSKALDCLKQQHDGKDVFPESAANDYSKGWATDGSNVRVLRALDYRTFYWMRSSADGRFFADGVSTGGEDSAVIGDLAAALDPAGPKIRDIWATARYDPDFFPDNKGFMFQGTPLSGGAYCAQSLLTNPSTTHIGFNEPECSALNQTGLYQTVGQRIGDNSISDHFIINGKFASDNPGLTSSDHDLDATFGPDAIATVRVMFALGNDDSSGYTVKQSVELKAPFLGDIMMTRSATVLGARVAGADSKMLGYQMEQLTSSMTADGYKFALKPVGRVCMQGNKANFSFDERMLVTHHYLTAEDWKGDAQAADYKKKGAADLWVADFVTGKKQRITHLQPGQFALFPHFRSDGWIYFMVRDANTKKEYIAASDWALRAEEATPTP